MDDERKHACTSTSMCLLRHGSARDMRSNPSLQDRGRALARSVHNCAPAASLYFETPVATPPATLRDASAQPACWGQHAAYAHPIGEQEARRQRPEDAAAVLHPLPAMATLPKTVESRHLQRSLVSMCMSPPPPLPTLPAKRRFANAAPHKCTHMRSRCWPYALWSTCTLPVLFSCY